MKEKDGKTPRFMVESTGIVKASLYTIRRTGYEVPREYKKLIECPEEKPVKEKKEKKHSIPEQEYAQFLLWKEACKKVA